jgi:hypothetical protein
MASEYLIQVFHKPSGKVVHSWTPGLEVEKQFEDELIDRVKVKAVGVGRTKWKVGEMVREALVELLYDLKSKV